MRKPKETLTTVGFASKENLGVIRYSPEDNYEPFEKKGKLGVIKKGYGNIIEAAFTYIEAFSIEYDVFFKVGNEDKYGLYDSSGVEIIPVQYERIDKISSEPQIFWAYTDIDKHHGDVYWRKGLLAKGCKECHICGFNAKVKYIDDEQELFDFCGNYEVNSIVKKGKYDIQFYKDYIIVDDEKPIVYNYKGCRISEDISGSYVRYGNYLVHVTDKPEKFYNDDGKEVELYKTYEDVVMEKEYVLGKHRGHWRLLYSV